MNKKKILIYGAGAIGRGYLAPHFCDNYNIYFVDSDAELIHELKSRNSYKTAFSISGKYELKDVKYCGAFIPGEEDEILKEADIVISCVGPRNISAFAKKLKNVPEVISFENERESVDKLKELSGNKNCFFGIPDVITSNDCPDELRKIDSLCLVSEKGRIIIEKGTFEFDDVLNCNEEEIKKHWACKFYLHNTPHAAAAFLGKLCEVKFLHEAMRIPSINNVVNSVMDTIKESLISKGIVDREFAEFYAKKEIDRFKDELLFDPISRVGRDPLRKLRKNDRLIQALKMIEETGDDTGPIIIVIKAALYDLFKNYQDEVNKLLNNAGEREILFEISGLNETRIVDKISEENIFNKILSLKIKNF